METPDPLGSLSHLQMERVQPALRCRSHLSRTSGHFQWEIYGKYGDLWEIYGKYMGNIWEIYGKYMGNIWDI